MSVQWLVYGYMTKETWFDSTQRKNFLFSKISGTALGPIQLLIQRTLRGCIPRDEAGGARSWPLTYIPLSPMPSWHVNEWLDINTLRTGDAYLCFYITTVQDGWRKSAILTRACFPCTIHLIMQYIEPVSEWSCWWMFIENWPHSELTFRHRSSSI